MYKKNPRFESDWINLIFFITPTQKVTFLMPIETSENNPF